MKSGKPSTKLLGVPSPRALALVPCAMLWLIGCGSSPSAPAVDPALDLDNSLASPATTCGGPGEPARGLQTSCVDESEPPPYIPENDVAAFCKRRRFGTFFTTDFGASKAIDFCAGGSKTPLPVGIFGGKLAGIAVRTEDDVVTFFLDYVTDRSWTYVCRSATRGSGNKAVTNDGVESFPLDEELCLGFRAVKVGEQVVVSRNGKLLGLVPAK